VSTSVRFTTGQRDLLLEHMDGKKIAFDSPPHSPRRGFTRSLLTQGLIEPVGGTPQAPMATIITLRGREVLGEILGDYADCLSRAGYRIGSAFKAPRSYTAGPETSSAAGIALRTFLTSRPGS
jgi:hypothetical protein